MTIDEITFEAFRKIFIKINDEHIPVEEVIANELKTTIALHWDKSAIKMVLNACFFCF